MQIPPIGCRSTGSVLLKSLQKLKVLTRWHRFIILPNVQERQGGTVTENKQKLHAMIDSISNEGIAEYLETFIRLFLEKWGAMWRE